MSHPYETSPAKAFWRSGVVETDRRRWPEIYTPAFPIRAETAVATAGSCFAQHIGRFLRDAGVNVLDVEPRPEGMSDEAAKARGYGLYSARYGNIYTARQLRELLEDAFEIYVEDRHFLTRDGAWFDALRPGVEPDGFATLEAAVEARRAHLLQVVELAQEMEVFIFTLGLTEGWIDRETGRVLAMAPGVIAGDYDPERYVFHNFTYDEIYADLVEIRKLLRGINPNVQLLLTVSPVPLTGTASDQHVLAATSYSKSVLRAVAGDLAEAYATVDYFPSYEIVTTWAAPEAAFAANLRSVRPEMVEGVMEVFLTAHGLETTGG
ncbi:GSCFA domain-containing protein [Celeribacter naphthalenivorans]|uniref:GSCFA domain-containing protein n=1 Tax=Celeribacter naphthalenivorans TaxID=1614694 RepID=UPI001CFBB350|nr:GSCFA domain-containing protein [Celeribacter naphthalenivorans]